jgi:maleylpyruvate isomerase
VHHADLAAGYSFGDVRPSAARLIIDDIIDALERRDDVPALRIEAGDTGLSREFGARAERSTAPVISGTQAELLAWLTGRSTGGGLQVTGAGEVPPAPYWI